MKKSFFLFTPFLIPSLLHAGIMNKIIGGTALALAATPLAYHTVENNLLSEIVSIQSKIHEKEINVNVLESTLTDAQAEKTYVRLRAIQNGAFVALNKQLPYLIFFENNPKKITRVERAASETLKELMEQKPHINYKALDIATNPAQVG